jgi:hypothetical protein
MKKTFLLLILLALFYGCSKEEDAVTGPDTTLKAPTDLKAARIGLTVVRLTWTDNTETEEGFIIERKAGEGLYAQQLFATRDAETAIDSVGLMTGTTYSYRIRAIRYSDRGEYSSAVTVTLSVPYP